MSVTPSPSLRGEAEAIHCLAPLDGLLRSARNDVLWLAMTPATCHRHCEERSDEAINPCRRRCLRNGLLSPRCAPGRDDVRRIAMKE